MSFVGPRPERPEIEAELAKSIPLFPVRHLVRPGLTGWAQVSAPYAATREDHLQKLRHDLYYLKYRSLALDAAIMLKTAYSVLKRKGR
jgi:lipopolysaccharide/colanic/teichoic acid biosynthesis glycosyltransferase